MKKHANSLVELLSTGDDTAPVLGAPGMPDLTYGALRKLIIGSVKKLNLYGLGRNDRIAIVLKNGPEMAVSFLAVACGTTSAPLNPAYRADEFEFYLSDLNAKALIVEAGTNTPAIGVAERLGIKVTSEEVNGIATRAKKLQELAGKIADDPTADVDYWKDRTKPDGTFETPEDLETAEKVINARMHKAEQAGKFSDTLYNE